MNKLTGGLGLLAFFTGVALAQDPRQIVKEVERRSRADSERYEGTLEVADAREQITTKRWVYERKGSFGESKAVLRFTAPPEVKRVALLVINHKDRASDQWMWRPAIEREQRIALQDRSTRFFGTDFSFEDLEERDADQYDFKMLGDEAIGGAACWKIESRPRNSSQYTYSYLWVRKDNYTFVRIEGYNKKGLARSIEYRDFEKNQNIWTARTSEVYDATRKSHTVLKLEKLQYNLPLPDDLFTVQALRRGS